MNEAVETGGRRESARRRLVRGAFAVPAVLALHSGSALAATSNLRCVNTQVANPIYPSYSDGPDVYVRVQLYSLSDFTGTLLGWYLAGSSVDAAGFGNRKVINNFLKSGEWQQIQLQDTGTALLVGTKTTTPPTGGNLALGPKYLALRFQPGAGGKDSLVKPSEVEILGVVDGSNYGSAVTGSCWSSFVGIA